jgi:hypothetical protein
LALVIILLHFSFKEVIYLATNNVVLREFESTNKRRYYLLSIYYQTINFTYSAGHPLQDDPNAPAHLVWQGPILWCPMAPSSPSPFFLSPQAVTLPVVSFCCKSLSPFLKSKEEGEEENAPTRYM